MLHLVFCADPLYPRQADSAFAVEVAAVERLGLPYSLVDYEALVNDQEPERAVRRVPEQSPPAHSLYRGWMLRPVQYAQLYQALARRGVFLINDPAAYRHTHYLPESYSLIAPYTSRTVWIPAAEATPDAIMDLLRPFGTAPVIVKDYVKSRKHEWAEACYIPSAADQAGVMRVVERFRELQGDDLNEGLVFREYVAFAPLAQHSRSGMPLTEEYRIFILDGVPIYWAMYWEEGDYGEDVPALDQFRPVAAAVQSRFFTMDIARTQDGNWLIVELGDGQVAGLPEAADPFAFYTALRDHWPDGPPNFA